MRRTSNITAFVALAFVTLAVGGVHTEVATGAALLGITAVAIQTRHLQKREHATLASFFGLSLLVAAVVSLLQLIPLPGFVHALLNPEGLALYERGLALAGLEPRWRPLSIDPAETADRAIRYIALAAIAIWAANVRLRHAWRRFALWFAPVALVCFLLGLTLQLTNASSFLGFYESAVGFRGPSTFVSTNHGAVFFGFVSLLAAAGALAYRRLSAPITGALGVAAAVAFVVALAHRSDGVPIALAATVPVAAGIRWYRRGRPSKIRKDIGIGVGLLAVFGALAVWWLDLHQLAGNFFDRVLLSGEHGGRLELLNAGSHALADFWRFGAGAGAIEAFLPAYVDWSEMVPASIPVIENDTLEVLLSFGVPIAGAMFVAAIAQVWALRSKAMDGQESPRYAVAIVVSVYLVLIAQLHFPLFALGIGMPAVAWLELLWSRRNKSSRGRRIFPSGHVALSPRLMLAGWCALLLATGVATTAHETWYAPAGAELDPAREIWLRPGAHEPYVHLAAAKSAADKPEAAAALAKFAVEREPSARVRLFEAKMLAGVDLSAAASAYDALFAEGNRSTRYLRSFLTNIKDLETRIDVLAQYPELWAATTRRLQRVEGVDAASSFVVRLAEKRPADAAVYALAATTYLGLGRPVLAQLWAELVRDAEAREPESPHMAAALLARALVASGRVTEAHRVLDQALKDPLVSQDVHRLALQLAGAPDRSRLEAVRAHYERLCASPVPKMDREQCWTAEAWLAESEGDDKKALRLLDRVHRKLGNPLPLARLLLRARRCDRLSELLLGSRGPNRPTLEVLTKRCQ